MKSYKYIIIGGGIAADSAIRGIRTVDPNGPIALFSAEATPPYNRPPLSKSLWLGKPLDMIWRHTEELKADLYLNTPVVKIDLNNKQVIDSSGGVSKFEKMLIATGAFPRKLQNSLDEIIYFRNLKDYLTLSERLVPGMSCAIIGGGFIGSELAAVLSRKGINIHLIFPESGITERIFPDEITTFLTNLMIQNGVNIHKKHQLNEIEKQGEGFKIIMSDENQVLSSLKVDVVIGGIGVIPETTLASQAGLKVENGIEVSRYLQASHPDVYAAGDVALYPDTILKIARRVEHEDNANMMGFHAGKNMAGEESVYTHLPFFYSDLFEIGYEAVGELDRRSNVIIDWEDPFHSGTLYYLKENIVRGILLWNNWGKIDHARSLIADGKPVSLNELSGTLNY